jgi:hypothetical protein
MIGHDLTRPEFASGPGRAILQYGDTQAYLRGRMLAVLRKDLPPAVFEYDGAATLTPAREDPDLVATAIAHADWSSATYEREQYRLPAVSGVAVAARGGKTSRSQTVRQTSIGTEAHGGQ